MSIYFDLASYCLASIKTVKEEIQRDTLLSEFEIDYEIAFVVFLASIVDGGLNPAERNFRDAVTRVMGWSQMHQALLSSRIDRQPTYSFSIFKAARENAHFGSVIYKLGYSTARLDGSLKRDEQFFLGNLRDTLVRGDVARASAWENEITQILLGSGENRSAVRHDPNSVPKPARVKDETVASLLGRTRWADRPAGGQGRD